MPEESLVSRTFQYKIIKIVVAVVLSLLILMPMTADTTWFNQTTMHQHALHMFVDFYDSREQPAAWIAYQNALEVYIQEAKAYPDQPIIMLVVPDPNGEPFNRKRKYITPNAGLIDTEPGNYRPEEQ